MLRPPVGVALLGFVALMAGFAYSVVGLRYLGVVTFGPASIGSGLVFWGAATLLVGILFFAVGFALWATQPWAWLVAHYLAIFGVLEAIFVMLVNESLTDGLAVAIFPLLVIWYLNDKDVKGAFGMPTG